MSNNIKHEFILKKVCLNFNANMSNNIKHEFTEWGPQITTCNKDTKNIIRGSTFFLTTKLDH
ncbi:hypothetical protein Hanom_Chr02g00164711 [Helianthus anomalus]